MTLSSLFTIHKKIPLLRNLSKQESLVLLSYVLFLILPFPLPKIIAEMIDTTFGIFIVLCAAIYLFCTTPPLLGVLSLVVAYELLRRSSRDAGLIINRFQKGDFWSSLSTTNPYDQNNQDHEKQNNPYFIDRGEHIVVGHEVVRDDNEKNKLQNVVYGDGKDGRTTLEQELIQSYVPIGTNSTLTSLLEQDIRNSTTSTNTTTHIDSWL